MLKKIMPILMTVAMVSLVAGCAAGPSGDDAEKYSSANSSASQQVSSSAVESEATTMSPNDTAATSESSDVTQVQLAVNGSAFTIDLTDNTTASAFAALLPMDVSMSELNGNEKYVYLDDALPTAAYNPGSIEAGDVMLYGDDCVVVFYESHPTSYSYTRIGKIADISGLANALGSGSVSASFTAIG